MPKKTNLFADKLVEKHFYYTRAQLNKTVDQFNHESLKNEGTYRDFLLNVDNITASPAP